MGERANVVIRSTWPDDLGDKEAVFLYTHWGKQDLPEVLRSALQKYPGRWDDESYLARIIFNEMVGEDREETGYGISTRLGDNEPDLLVLFQRKGIYPPRGPL